MTHRSIKIGFAMLALLVFFFGLFTVWSGEFFVDKGEIESIDGVAFEIVPPHLFIKKAFKLRGENLTPAQLRIIRDAMPAIASMTHQVLTRAAIKQAEAQEQAQPRNIYQILNIESPVQLYIQTLKNWQLTETTLQFSSDYFYTSNEGHRVNFRDSYLFTKTQLGWQFLRHPHKAPDGLLKCHKSAEGWMRCD